MGVEEILEVGSIPLGMHDGVVLEARVLEPASKAKGIIFFTGGVTSRFQDYEPLLRGLQAEGFRVGSWNYRGHALSEGAFTYEQAAHDIQAVKEELFRDKPVFTLGHSLGVLYTLAQAHALNTNRTVAIAPFIDKYHVAWHMMLGLLLAQGLQRLGLEALGDRVVLMQNSDEEELVHTKKPMHAFAELAKAAFPTKPLTDFHLAYILPGQDRVIGTHKQKRHEAVARTLNHVAPGAIELMPMGIRYLNHCLNYVSGDYAPVAKHPVDARAVVKSITGFFS